MALKKYSPKNKDGKQANCGLAQIYADSTHCCVSCPAFLCFFHMKKHSPSTGFEILHPGIEFHLGATHAHDDGFPADLGFGPGAGRKKFQ
jgi:hypothetical protein